MVRRWFEEALIGIFMEALKSWMAKDLKLKQPTRLHEVMWMVEILEDIYAFEGRQSKDVGSWALKLVQTKAPWKGKEVMGSSFKPKAPEIKKYPMIRYHRGVRKDCASNLVTSGITNTNASLVRQLC